MNKHRGVESALKKNQETKSAEGRAEADEGTHCPVHLMEIKENKN